MVLRVSFPDPKCTPGVWWQCEHAARPLTGMIMMKCPVNSRKEMESLNLMMHRKAVWLFYCTMEGNTLGVVSILVCLTSLVPRTSDPSNKGVLHCNYCMQQQITWHLTPVFVTCSTNVGEGLVKHITRSDVLGCWVDVWRSGTFPEKLHVSPLPITNTDHRMAEHSISESLWCFLGSAAL